MKQTDKKNSTLRIIISGGGTGGHIFPAISIANEFRRRHPDAEILFVGAENRMEMERVPAAGYNIVGLPVAGFDRKRLWRNFAVLVKLYKSLHKAKSVIRRFDPQIAIGVGGYASGPVLKCAQKLGIPTLLQEQNSYAGVTNKMLAAKAGAICVAYEGMDRYFPAEKIIITGNPIRSSILECALPQSAAKQQLGFDPERPLVLVVGGSLGSKTINDAVTKSLPLFAGHNISVLWQTGRRFADQCLEVAKDMDGVQPMPFIDDMALAYRAADLVVARAGASTISELQLLGKPSILIPSPNVAEDHQTKNAMALVNRDAVAMIPDNEAPDRLGNEVINILFDKTKLDDMHRNISAMALDNAATKIVDKAEELIARQK